MIRKYDKVHNLNVFDKTAVLCTDCALRKYHTSIQSANNCRRQLHITRTTNSNGPMEP